jgi:hypothetical protein
MGGKNRTIDRRKISYENKQDFSDINCYTTYYIALFNPIPDASKSIG